MSDEKINSVNASNYNITPEVSYYDSKTIEKFKGSCLKQYKVTHNHGTIVNIYIVYEIRKNYNISSHPPFSLTKHVHIDQYKYSGHGIGFDRKVRFSVGNEFGKNCINFGVDMSSSVHVDN